MFPACSSPEGFWVLSSVGKVNLSLHPCRAELGFSLSCEKWQREELPAISGFSPSKPFLVRAITFLWKQAALMDSQDVVVSVRRHILRTSVHFFIQAFAEMLSVSILWQAVS